MSWTEPGPRPEVIVVGGGLSGLTMALDLRRGQRVTLLDDDNTVGVRGLASRGMVWAQRTLDIFDRLDVADAIVAKGCAGTSGVLCRDAAVASFTLQAQPDVRHNGFVNLQQYYLEAFLVEALQREPLAELRWLNRVDAIDSPADGGPVTLRVHARGRLPHAGRMGDRLRRCQQPAAPGAGPAARGVRPQRGPLDHHRRGAARYVLAGRALDLAGRRQQPRPGRLAPQDGRRHLAAGLPAASRRGRAGGLYATGHAPARLGPAGRTGRFRYRLARRLGLSPRMPARPARHGRVLFAGDSAHLVAPFGARAATAASRTPTIGWKLALVLQGRASDTLLDSYSAERKHAAQENIRQARRSSRFVHPGPAESARMRRTPSSRWPRATTCPRA